MTLKDWLSEKEITVPEFARTIEVPSSTLYRIIKDNRSGTHAITEKIIVATDGAVLPNDFFDLSKLLNRSAGEAAV